MTNTIYKQGTFMQSHDGVLQLTITITNKNVKFNKQTSTTKQSHD